MHPSPVAPPESYPGTRHGPLPGSPPLPGRHWLTRLRLAFATLLAAGLVVLAGCDSAQRSTTARSNDKVIDTLADPTVDVTTIPAGRAFDARAARIHDGDSFDLALRVQGQRVGVRISGIDAPERRQPWADVARRHLQTLIANQRIRVHILGRDRYGRILGRVEVSVPGKAAATGRRGPAGAAPGADGADGSTDDRTVDVGQAQLAAGLAWFYRRYEKDLPVVWRERYDEAEAAARRQQRGLWQEPKPVEPWRYRESRRNASRSNRDTAISP